MKQYKSTSEIDMEHLIAVGAHVGAVLSRHELTVDIEDLSKVVQSIYTEIAYRNEDISFMEKLNQLDLYEITYEFEKLDADIENKYQQARHDLNVRGERYATLHVYREENLTELNEVVSIDNCDYLEPIMVIADYPMTDQEVENYIEDNKGEILFEMGVALT